MDRLIDAIASLDNPSVVGLDPTPALMPAQLLSVHLSHDATVAERNSVAAGGRHDSMAALAEAFDLFNTTIIDAVAGIVPAVKVQVAMYEFLGPLGLEVYDKTCWYAQQHGLYVIGDIKRGDIGSTATAYAAHLAGSSEFPDALDTHWHEAAITVNPYLGEDGITPFVEMAMRNDRDVFILVRTSNPSSAQIQGLELRDGGTVVEHVADLVEQWGASSVSSQSGYSRVGAVVGATHPDEGRALRARMPHTFFLVPGYGAQGGSADDVAGMFDAHGSGAVVNSSRGIIGAWRDSGGYREELSLDETLQIVGTSARNAALAMRNDLRATIHGITARTVSRTSRT